MTLLENRIKYSWCIACTCLLTGCCILIFLFLCVTTTTLTLLQHELPLKLIMVRHLYLFLGAFGGIQTCWWRIPVQILLFYVIIVMKLYNISLNALCAETSYVATNSLVQSTDYFPNTVLNGATQVIFSTTLTRIEQEAM